MIALVDYGMGNIGSIVNMLKRIGAGVCVCVAQDSAALLAADKYILPGVGAFDRAMRNLRDRGLDGVLTEQVVARKKPVLGICLGMQLMSASSEEGSESGLGWIDAATRRFSFPLDGACKIPHMGWNTLSAGKESALFASLDGESRFYFVHSYHVVCNDPGDVLATTRHGYDFVSALQRGNIMGVQFHPEKSHRFGMAVLKNFTAL